MIILLLDEVMSILIFLYILRDDGNYIFLSDDGNYL